MAIVLEATISSSTSLMKFMKSFFLCVKVSRKLCRSLREGSASLETSNGIWLVVTYRQVESLDINDQSLLQVCLLVVTIASKLKWPELPHPTLDTYLREYFNTT